VTSAGDHHVMGVSALRQLSEAQLAATYSGTRQSAEGSKVGEIAMVYADADCQGMSFSSWTLAAVLKQAANWNLDEIVLEATAGARSLYENVYKFRAYVNANVTTGSTPMSLMLK